MGRLSVPRGMVCASCRFHIPPPINDCMKHTESGSKIGELVMCRVLTNNPKHKNFWQRIKTNKDRVVGNKGGMKDDKKKIRMELLPFDSVREVAKVMTHGAEKYEPDNWKKVEVMRYVGAFLRHLVDWMLGETIDKDSGLRLTSHMACNALFINHIDMRDNAEDKS